MHMNVNGAQSRFRESDHQDRLPSLNKFCFPGHGAQQFRRLMPLGWQIDVLSRSERAAPSHDIRHGPL